MLIAASRTMKGLTLLILAFLFIGIHAAPQYDSSKSEVLRHDTTTGRTDKSYEKYNDEDITASRPPIRHYNQTKEEESADGKDVTATNRPNKDLENPSNESYNTDESDSTDESDNTSVSNNTGESDNTEEDDSHSIQDKSRETSSRRPRKHHRNHKHHKEHSRRRQRKREKWCKNNEDSLASEENEVSQDTNSKYNHNESEIKNNIEDRHNQKRNTRSLLLHEIRKELKNTKELYKQKLLSDIKCEYPREIFKFISTRSSFRQDLLQSIKDKCREKIASILAVHGARKSTDDDINNGDEQIPNLSTNTNLETGQNSNDDTEYNLGC